MSSLTKWGFPDSSVGKESVCNAGDQGLIPGSGRCPGEGIGYPLQYSWWLCKLPDVTSLTDSPQERSEAYSNILCVFL